MRLRWNRRRLSEIAINLSMAMGEAKGLWTKLAEWKWDVKSLKAKLSQLLGQACLAKFIKHLTNRAHQGNLMCFGVIQLNKVPKFLAQFSG